MDTDKLREKIAHLVCGHPECFGTCMHYRGKGTPCASVVPDQIIALFPDIVAKLKQAVKDTRDGRDIDLPKELYELIRDIKQALREEQSNE